MHRLVVVIACATLLASAPRRAGAQVRGDFNGDGFDDLAVGAPFEDIVKGGLTMTDAGVVNVFYGSASGLNGVPQQTLSQDTAGVAGLPADADRFGDALAVGHFNDDEFADLAVGVPGETVNAEVGAGAVHIFFGSASGLTGAGSQFFNQDVAGIASDGAEASDAFGRSLAVGNFNGDDFDDLAIGVPSEDVGAVAIAGAVHALLGSAAGLSIVGDQFWTEDVIGADPSESGDAMGGSLASGDFDGDGFDDLAIGSAGENVGAVSRAGAVGVLFGTSIGLDALGNVLLTQAGAITDTAESNDFFGSTLAAGDFNGDDFSDLAIGVPLENLNGLTDCGAVNVLFGSSTGLVTAGQQFLSQGGLVDGVQEASDRFGSSLLAVRVNDDARDDLIVGVIGEDSGAGAMNVFLGGASGLNQFRFQAAKVLGGVHAGDGFASALAAGDFNGDGKVDIAIGVAKDDVAITSPPSTVQDAGSVTVILNPRTVQFLRQNESKNDVEAGDGFGDALGARP